MDQYEKELYKGRKFIDHIKDHLKDSEEVVCKICGKTVDEIFEGEVRIYNSNNTVYDISHEKEHKHLYTVHIEEVKCAICGEPKDAPESNSQGEGKEYKGDKDILDFFIEHPAHSFDRGKIYKYLKADYK